MDQSRRQFLTRVGSVGGYGATYGAMRALGIFESDAAVAALPNNPTAGKGKTVVVLGGGMAGLAAAYQLQQLGFETTVLEAQPRPGGRVWTIRPGDRIEQVGWPDQTCTFDDGLYLNAGAGRLPGDHRLVMRYCKELGIPLEVLVNDCRSALDQSDAEGGGKPVQLRQVTFDTRGRIAELLASAAGRNSLDQPISDADRAKLLQFLKGWGDLGADYRYRGSERAGYSIAPGAGRDGGTVVPPLSLETVMDPALYRGAIFSESFDMQATMFQAVGGMDHLPKALAARLSRPVMLGAEVTSIRRAGKGVVVGYTKQDAKHSISADYCVCTLPLNLLKNIPADFSPAFRTAIGQRPYENATKIVFQAPRFWEDEAIYGGLSFTGRDSKLVWYPSAGFHAERGVLVAGYSFGGAFGRLSQRDFADRARYARETIEILHPGHSASLKQGLQIEWGRVPHSMGSWASMEDNPPGYDTLLSPDGPLYFAGDHVSHLVGWIEGAVSSAHRVVAMMAEREGAAA